VDIPMVNAIRVSRRKMRALCAEGINIEVCSSIFRYRRLVSHLIEYM
jgi:hypothetical protein